MGKRREASTDQGDLFRPKPKIGGKTNASGRDVFYCRDRCVWTIDPNDLRHPGAVDEAARAKAVKEFDEVWPG